MIASELCNKSEAILLERKISSSVRNFESSLFVEEILLYSGKAYASLGQGTKDKTYLLQLLVMLDSVAVKLLLFLSILVHE